MAPKQESMKESYGETAERAEKQPNALASALAIALRVSRQAPRNVVQDAKAKAPKSHPNTTRKHRQAQRVAHLRAASTTKQRAPHFAKFVDG